MATKNQIKGGNFQDLQGNVLANGYILLQLNQDCSVNGTTEIASGSVIRVQLDSTGNVSVAGNVQVWPNDVLSPSNNYYIVKVYSAAGQLVWGPNTQQILSSPSPFDLGSWVPNYLSNWTPLVLQGPVGPIGPQGIQGLTGPAGPAGSGAFTPNTITDPWVDVRAFGVDCTMATDSTTALTNAVTNGKKVLFPPGCKVRVTPGLFKFDGVMNGWEWAGMDTTQDPNVTPMICGVGGTTGTTVPVVWINRMQQWRIHGITIQGTCPNNSPSAANVGLLVTNNGNSGFTSTKWHLDHFQINAGVSLFTGGEFYPIVGTTSGLIAPNAQDGNQVADIQMRPGLPNIGIHQETSTSIVNGTNYQVSVQVTVPNWPSFITFQSGNATASLTANGVVVATTNCTVALGTWTACVVNYTGTAGTSGQTLGITLTNTTVVTSGVGEIWFDNVVGTNITGITNPSFETPTLPNNGNGTQSPAVTGWSYVSGESFTAIQVGSCDTNLGSTANCTVNNEQWDIHDGRIDAGGGANSAGISSPVGCCVEGVRIQDITINNAADGIIGNIGGVFWNIYSGSVANFSLYGAGHAQVNLKACPAGHAILHNIDAEPGGPILRDSCDEITWMGQLFSNMDIGGGDYAINIGSLSNAQTNINFSATSSTITSTADYIGIIPGTPNPSNSIHLSFDSASVGSNANIPVQNVVSQALKDCCVVSLPYNRVGLELSATAPLINANNGVISPDLTFIAHYWNGSTGNNRDTYSLINSSSSLGSALVLGHHEGLSTYGLSIGMPLLGGLTVNSLSPVANFDGISNIGTAGSTTDIYHIVACGSGGCTTIETNTANSTTATANATLSSTNYNKLVWRSSIGAAFWKIYRIMNGQVGLTTGLIGTVYANCPNGFSGSDCLTGVSLQNSYSFNDTGINGDGTAPPVNNSTGLVLANAGFQTGNSGTLLSRYGRYSATLSPAAVAANTCAAQVFTFTGVNSSDILIGLNKPTEQAGLLVTPGHIGGTNTVTINFCNVTAGSITPTASEIYNIVVVQ